MTFGYRGNPLVQQARHAIARGDIGKPHFLVNVGEGGVFDGARASVDVSYSEAKA